MSSMSSNRSYSIKSANHPKTFVQRLANLYRQQKLVDVSLVCNACVMKVHSAVLAAFSPFFEKILQNQTKPNTVIALKDIPYDVLKAIIHFMYFGEARISHELFNSFVATAKRFEIESLLSLLKNEFMNVRQKPADTVSCSDGQSGIQVFLDYVQSPTSHTSIAGKKFINPTGLSGTEYAFMREEEESRKALERLHRYAARSGNDNRIMKKMKLEPEKPRILNEDELAVHNLTLALNKQVQEETSALPKNEG